MKDLIVYGLNYHNCPVAIRERFTIPESCLEHALAGLKRLPHIIEAVVLSTCNRTEIYAVVSDVAAGFKELEAFFQAARQITDHQALQANFKLLRSDAALHLMRVASGLDSMVLGEGQIMSQVKAAHQAALRAGTAGAILDGLFKAALNCGKKVRSQTSLGRRAVSISSAAVELTRKLLGDLSNRKIALIGAGRMGQICIKLLLNDQNNCSVYVLNRSESKTKALLAANIRHLDRLYVIEDFSRRHEIVASCDAVIVAASANEFLLTPEGFERQSLNERCASDKTILLEEPVGAKFMSPFEATINEGRRAHDETMLSDETVGAAFMRPFEATMNEGRSAHDETMLSDEIVGAAFMRPFEARSSEQIIHIIDMSVPRNVDPRIAELPGIQLHNFDDLAAIVKQNMAEREALTADAEIIIFASLKEFERWEQNQLAAPVIAQLRGKVENIRQSHLTRHPSSKRQAKQAINKHVNLQLDKISRVLVNEILHKPTTKLKAAKDYQSLQKQTEVLRSLFDLES